ncbi:MAG: aminoglycoside phosphotransferase family protein, partial [Bryobacteraceae bacterium]
MSWHVPARVAANCGVSGERREWLARLPETVRALEQKWALTAGDPFDGEEVSCAWVAPAALRDGTAAVLKLGMPHMEAEHEAAGLRFWAGNATVRLLREDQELGAMLLEKCEPGSWLRALPEPEQDRVIAGLLRRMWRPVPAGWPFRP